jgi:hypothetical protein
MDVSDERWDYDLGLLLRVLGVSPDVHPGGRRLAAVAGGLVLLAAAAAIVWTMSRPASPPPGISDISGRWAADVQYDFGARHTEVFVLRMTGAEITGTASFLGLDRGITEGRIEENRVSFTTQSDELLGDEVRSTEHHYRGTIEDGQLRLVMQTEGGVSPHAPVEIVAGRAPPAPSTPPGSPPPSGGPRPWPETQAALTLNDGKVVVVRAETFSNCISVAHDLTLTGGQSVPFENMQSFEVLRADSLEVPNARADLRITLLTGQTIEDSHPAGCDLFGFNEAGRFATWFQNLKRVEFQR